MGNNLTSLPADVDSVLMDLAQAFESEDGDSIDYGNIMDWSNKATDSDIEEMREKIADLADLDFAFEDDEDAMEIATDIVKTVKGVSVC